MQDGGIKAADNVAVEDDPVAGLSSDKVHHTSCGGAVHDRADRTVSDPSAVITRRPATDEAPIWRNQHLRHLTRGAALSWLAGTAPLRFLKELWVWVSALSGAATLFW